MFSPERMPPGWERVDQHPRIRRTSTIVVGITFLLHLTKGFPPPSVEFALALIGFYVVVKLGPEWTWRVEPAPERLRPWNVSAPANVRPMRARRAIARFILYAGTVAFMSGFTALSVAEVLSRPAVAWKTMAFAVVCAVGPFMIFTVVDVAGPLSSNFLQWPATTPGRRLARLLLLTALLVATGFLLAPVVEAGRRFRHDARLPALPEDVRSCYFPDPACASVLEPALVREFVHSVHYGRFFWRLFAAEVPLAFIVLMGIRTARGFVASRRRRVRLPQVVPTPGPVTRLRVAHWSDLHLTTGDDATGLEGGVPMHANARLSSLASCFGAELAACDCVIITGDMTDTGQPDEWRRFYEILDRLPGGVRERLVVVPGNHDVNIVDPRDRTAVEPGHGRLRAVRRLRMIAAIDDFQGERSFLLDESGRLVRLRDHLDVYRRPLLDSLDAGCADAWVHYRGRTWSLGNTVDRIWGQIFPMLVRTGRPGQEIEAVVFDSNAPAGNLATNALGSIPGEAFRRLAAMAALPEWAERPKVYCLHHHVVPPREPLPMIKQAQELFMVLDGADAFLDSLPVSGHAVVLHGHRHISRYDEVHDGRITVVGAPSTTLGDSNPRSLRDAPGFEVLELEAAGAHRTHVVDRVLLVDESFEPPASAAN